MLTRRSLFGFFAVAPFAAAGLAPALECYPSDSVITGNIIISTGGSGIHQAGLQRVTVTMIGGGGGGSVFEGNTAWNASAGRFDA